MQKKLFQTFKKSLFISCVFLCVTNLQTFSGLLDKDEVREENHCVVRVWPHATRMHGLTRYPGHCSLELFEGGESTDYLSLWPATPYGFKTGWWEKKKPRWQTLKGDDIYYDDKSYNTETELEEYSEVRLYSLHPERLRYEIREAKADPDIKYGVLQYNNTYHCASIAHRVLLKCDIDELWPALGGFDAAAQTLWAAVSGIPRAAVAVALDAVRTPGLLSKSIREGRNAMAMDNLTRATNIQFSYTERIHDGELMPRLVTPQTVETLSTKARELEIKKFRRTRKWQ